MKKRLVIFGSGKMAELAHYYFSMESPYEVVAFAIDATYINEPLFCGLPVVAFEEVSRHYPPEDHDFFVAVGYSKLNSIRKEKFFIAKNMGYTLVNFISPKAIILNNGNIGENCFIFENVTIQPLVRIGDNVTIWSGSVIGHHSVIHDHTFISLSVAIAGGVEVGEQCFIGVNATLRDHIKIGERCVLGAGTLLLADAEPNGVYIGAGTQRSALDSAKLKGI